MSGVWQVALHFLLIFAALADFAAAQDVTLRWLPANAPDIVGYRAYIGRSTAGPIVAAPLDVGLPQPDAEGVSSAVVAGIDRTESVLVIEMTSYDSLGRESVRSNRMLLLGDRERVDPVSWQADFDQLAEGARAPGFIDLGGAFGIRQVSDLNLANATAYSGDTGLRASRYIANLSAAWAPYEIEGRIQVLLGTTAAGIGVRVGTFSMSSAYILGGDAAGEFALDQLGKPALTCRASPSTGVRFSRGRWYRFKLRHTTPEGRARLRAKVWRPGEVEPSVWQADCWTTVPTAIDSGTFALYQAGSGITYWDDLLVRPVTGTYSVPPLP